MSSLFATRSARPPPVKRRRTATAVLAGDFDPRPPRDVLTSLLNGVRPYKLVEGDEEDRRLKRRERKRLEKEMKRLRKQQARAELPEDALRQHSAGHSGAGPSNPGPSNAQSARASGEPAVNFSTSSFWRTRGPALAATRSVSPSPPPELSSPPTPGPSISSTMSYGSSRRPHTPEDGFSLLDDSMASSLYPTVPKPRKKRAAAKKGWKGWVEGSPPPSDKLINLDAVPVMVERRTRSGKNFDAISEGTDTWVSPVPDH